MNFIIGLTFVLSLVAFVAAEEPRGVRGSKLQEAKAAIENIKKMMQESASKNLLSEEGEAGTETAFPTWAYWAIGGGTVLFILVSYVVYRYLVWVPKKKLAKKVTGGATTSDSESSKLIVTSDSQ